MPEMQFASKIGTLWKRMLVSQPPIKTLEYCDRCPHRVALLSCDTGLTLGHLFDVLEEIKARHNTKCDASCYQSKKKYSRFFEVAF